LRTIKLNYTRTKYYRLLQNLQKQFTVELQRNMNLSCLFTNTTRQVYSKATETILNYIDVPSFKKFQHKIILKNFRTEPPPLVTMLRHFYFTSDVVPCFFWRRSLL